jgi:hypothetical protein
MVRLLCTVPHLEGSRHVSISDPSMPMSEHTYFTARTSVPVMSFPVR